MDAECAVVRFWAGYWAIWHRTFPRLHKRSHWNIVSHLCSQAQAGAPLGEISGLIRQLLLLDDATVRDRVAEMLANGDCLADPPGPGLSARSILTPSATLIEAYDRVLLDLLRALAEVAPALDPGLAPVPPPRLDPALREDALAAIDTSIAHWAGLLEKLFAARGLSQARRVEARRNLLSTSHRTLLITAMEHHYGLLQPVDPAGIMADRMAAIMLATTGQNFQTTRDHIAFMLDLGVFRRMPGKALRVTLSEAAVPLVRGTLRDAAGALAVIARRVAAPDQKAHRLHVTPPGGVPHVVVMKDWPFTIGRIAGNSLELPAADISRQHCRIDLESGVPVIQDLGSKNHTVVNGASITGPARLGDGAVIRLGQHQLKYLAPVQADDGTETVEMFRV